MAEHLSLYCHYTIQIFVTSLQSKLSSSLLYNNTFFLSDIIISSYMTESNLTVNSSWYKEGIRNNQENYDIV